MDKKIIDFIMSQKIATLCCNDPAGDPYCFTCFYTFDAKTHSLLFKSSKESYHMQLMVKKPTVAGTVIENHLKLSSLKGIQFKGQFQHQENTAALSIMYHKKFPFALAFKGDVCAVKLLSIKMTDNSIGFARKIIWDENAATHESEPVHDQNHAEKGDKGDNMTFTKV